MILWGDEEPTNPRRAEPGVIVLLFATVWLVSVIMAYAFGLDEGQADAEVAQQNATHATALLTRCMTANERARVATLQWDGDLRKVLDALEVRP